LRGDAGDGIGYKRGFTHIEAMLPIWQGDRSLTFADVRLVNFLHENRWEYNLGGGYRWYSDRYQRVFGLNAFYDARKTGDHYYQQLGIGFETLTPNVEFRTNGYFIVGAAHRVIADTGFVNRGVVNNNTVFQRLQTVETALGGLDAEIGCRLPFLDRYAARGYIGYYTYAAEGIPVLHGIRGRLEMQLSEQVSAHFSVQNDRLFDTTVTGGLAVHFGAPAYRTGTGRASWYDVLHQRVVRDVNIVITNTTVGSTNNVPVPPAPPPAQPEELSVESLR
jgi:hypothetical protein